MQPWHVCILIPAKNEEKLLARCLNSVLMACNMLPHQTTFDIILVIDSSSDNSLHIGQGILQQKGIVIPILFSNVGRVRHFAASMAMERYKGDLSRCWIANTDADCHVPPSWLTEQLKYADEGYQAVAGIVSVDSFEEHDSSVEEKFKLSYLIHPDGTHPHIHGANLGIRADSYIEINGWPLIETAEDHALWNKLRHNNARCISIASLYVVTSGRRVGRAPHGFANSLAMHNEIK